MGDLIIQCNNTSRRERDVWEMKQMGAAINILVNTLGRVQMLPLVFKFFYTGH